jgi:hypothetical protein
MLPAMNRTLALGAAWTGSAVAAVGLGFLAVSLVGASASPGTVPVAAGGTSSSASATPTSPAAPAPVVSSAEQATVGGTVYADCTSGVPGLAGAPAPGWWLDDSDDPGEVEFKNGIQKVEVHTVCAGGSPQFSVEGPRDDNSGSGSGSGSGSSSSSSPASSSASESTSGGDDSGGDDSKGRGRGGDDSGSDDSGGDDSSGRDGGGHGSDD